jgi:hypothetical protein
VVKIEVSGVSWLGRWGALCCESDFLIVTGSSKLVLIKFAVMGLMVVE